MDFNPGKMLLASRLPKFARPLVRSCPLLPRSFPNRLSPCSPARNESGRRIDQLSLFLLESGKPYRTGCKLIPVFGTASKVPMKTLALIALSMNSFAVHIVNYIVYTLIDSCLLLMKQIAF
jgi:hypothetical protein